MYTVGRVLAVLPVDNIMNYLNQLLMPYVEELQYLVTLEVSKVAVSFTDFIVGSLSE
jgi:hypothetical protein